VIIFAAMADIGKRSINEVKLIVHGFLLTFRGSAETFHGIKGKIVEFKDNFSISELAAVVKSYHITENEDEEFYNDIEKISNKLKM
jgi:hypothetical protein